MKINKIVSSAKFIFMLTISSGLFSKILAAGEEDFPPNYYDIVAFFLIGIIILSIAALIYFESTNAEERFSFKPLIAKAKQLMTRATPVEKENEIMFEHDYDGIRELDNKIPPWFTGLFWITILFSVYYMLHFHVLGTGDLQIEEYEEEVRLAEIKKAELLSSGALINEETVEFVTDEQALQSGKAVYDANCIACHSQNGGGLVGPNLTDEYWIHGGGIKNVFKIVKYGVPAKGMVSWENQLNPKQIQEVSSYVLTLPEVEPPVGKTPEGEIWKEEAGDTTNVNSNDDIET